MTTSTHTRRSSLHRPFRRMMVGMALACSILPARSTSAQGEGIWAVPPAIDTKIRPFDLSQVRVTGGPFRHAQDLDATYLLTVDPDRLLSGFRKTAGLEPKGEVYGGWESMGIAGHSLGHYLTACSIAYESTGQKAFKGRAEYIVNEIIACQNANGSGYAAAIPDGKRIFDEVSRGEIRSAGFDLNGGWVPWYTMHKIMAGLRDAYLLCHIVPARAALIRMADWVFDTTDHLTHEQIQKMLACEQGGMNEVLADVYAMTSDRRYLDLARRVFYHEAVLDPLARGDDRLHGLHANTQIPKIVGQARLFEVTGDPGSREIASFFWDDVARNYTYANGGNSTNEHFGPPDEFADQLVNTTETCNTYNMLKLTQHLYAWDPSPAYMDYYERALYNHILAQQNPETGMMMYFGYLDPGTHKTFSTPFDTWSCCHDSGMENHVKYGAAVYAREETDRGEDLVVNLYLPTTLDWAERGVRIEQNTDFPFADESTITIHADRPVEMSVRLRHPAWAANGMRVWVNGTAQPDSSPSSYLTVRRTWNDADEIRVRLPMHLRYEPTPDSSNLGAFFFGPLLLAAEVEEGVEPPVIVGSPDEVVAALEPVEGKPLHFVAKGVERSIDYDDLGSRRDLRLRPLFGIYKARYSVYQTILDTEAWSARANEIAAKARALAELDARTIDSIRMGEMQPERDHNVRGEKTRAGQNWGKKWRDAFDGGWFTFDMKVKGDTPMGLQCQYWGGDGGGREFDIEIDGQVIASQVLANNKPGEFFTVLYRIPEELTRGKDSVEVKIQAHPGKVAGGLFGTCRMLEMRQD
ncbi:MAG: glycoside hydrolase family 127 protein [Phycisphaeraceae bacterium]|nr:MAG: glycoside hydrolase family 127 protein [Phycisphaeraceae bacterium]